MTSFFDDSRAFHGSSQPFNQGKAAIAFHYLTDVQAATVLGCSPSKLRQDRHKCRGLPYYRIGRSIRYRLEDLEAFMVSNMVTPIEG